MKVYIVTIDDVEGTAIKAVCATKEIAVKILFEERDNLIKGYKEQIKYFKKEYPNDDMYEKMVENLSHDDYENWRNYPHDVPHIREFEVIDK